MDVVVVVVLIETNSFRLTLTFSTCTCKQPKQSTGVEGKGARISSMKSAVTDTFPEPNRRLLQRFAQSYYPVFPPICGHQE